MPDKFTEIKEMIDSNLKEMEELSVQERVLMSKLLKIRDLLSHNEVEFYKLIAKMDKLKSK